MVYQSPVVVSAVPLSSSNANVRIPGITGELYVFDYSSEGFFHKVQFFL
jgi:hypothetical protein